MIRKKVIAYLLIPLGLTLLCAGCSFKKDEQTIEIENKPPEKQVQKTNIKPIPETKKYDLYLILKPWDECICNDETLRKALQRKLDKWKSK